MDIRRAAVFLITVAATSLIAQLYCHFLQDDIYVSVATSAFTLVFTFPGFVLSFVAWQHYPKSLHFFVATFMMAGTIVYSGVVMGIFYQKRDMHVPRYDAIISAYA